MKVGDCFKLGMIMFRNCFCYFAYVVRSGSVVCNKYPGDISFVLSSFCLPWKMKPGVFMDERVEKATQVRFERFFVTDVKSTGNLFHYLRHFFFRVSLNFYRFVKFNSSALY